MFLTRNEDALEDFHRALELMRDSLIIDYSSLGMDLVLCSFQIHMCIAAVKSCLNLHEGARRSHQKALATKKALVDDPPDNEKFKMTNVMEVKK